MTLYFNQTSLTTILKKKIFILFMSQTLRVFGINLSKFLQIVFLLKYIKVYLYFENVKKNKVLKFCT